MALGGVVAVMVVFQFGLGILLEMASVRWAEAWLLPTYLLAWMTKKVTLQDYDSCNFSYSGECNPPTLDITWQQSSVLLVVGTARDPRCRVLEHAAAGHHLTSRRQRPARPARPSGVPDVRSRPCRLLRQSVVPG